MAFKNTAPTEWGSKDTAPAASASLSGQGPPVTLAKLEGDAQTTQMCVVSMHALPVILPSSPNRPFAAGPIVGIVEWSGGGGGGQIEFDVPCNRAGGNIAGGLLPGVSPGGGAMVAVPASNVKAYARNDAGVLVGTLAGATTLGNPLKALWPIVAGFVGYGPKTGRLTRTIWAVKQQPGQGVPAGTEVFINVPPYARSFSLLRNQTVPADFIDVTLMGQDGFVGVFPLETVPIVGTALSPVVQLGATTFLRVTFRAGNAGTLENCCVVFDIEN